MKTWVWLLAAVLGGYFVYNAWFDPEVAEESAEEPPVLEVATSGESEEPEAAAKESAPRRRIDLDFGGEAGPVLAETDGDPVARKLEEQRQVLLDKGDEEGARRIAKQILDHHPQSDPARWLQYERGREHLARYRALGRNKEGLEQAREAWRLLTPALFVAGVAPGERERLIDELDKLAQDLLFGARHVDGVDWIYKPKSGDTLIKLCRKVFPAKGSRVSPGLVAAVNRMASPSALRAGEPIRVPLGEARIVVVKSEFRLYFLINECFVRAFPVGLGREGGTPEATFIIDNKMKNPDWFPRAGVKIPYGHPENILGSRWLGFKNTAEYRGFGIHGTSDPSSIGKEESSGCIRMLRSDVETLYEWARAGTTVAVRR